MLGYLLSRPDDWKVLVKDLQRRGNLGRDGIYRLLRELRDVGYVRYQKVRDARGRMRGGDYIVREIPSAPLPDVPDTALPDTAPPDPVNPEALPNTAWEGKSMLDFHISTLDDPDSFPSDQHAFYNERISWYEAVQSRPCYGCYGEGRADYRISET